MPCQLRRNSRHTWCVFQVISSARSGLASAHCHTRGAREHDDSRLERPGVVQGVRARGPAAGHAPGQQAPATNTPAITSSSSFTTTALLVAQQPDTPPATAVTTAAASSIQAG